MGPPWSSPRRTQDDRSRKPLRGKGLCADNAIKVFRAPASEGAHHALIRLSMATARPGTGASLRFLAGFPVSQRAVSLSHDVRFHDREPCGFRLRRGTLVSLGITMTQNSLCPHSSKSLGSGRLEHGSDWRAGPPNIRCAGAFSVPPVSVRWLCRRSGTDRASGAAEPDHKRFRIGGRAVAQAAVVIAVQETRGLRRAATMTNSNSAACWPWLTASKSSHGMVSRGTWCGSDCRSAGGGIRRGRGRCAGGRLASGRERT